MIPQIILSLFLVALVICFYLYWRNNKTHNFLDSIINKDFNRAMKAIDNGTYDRTDKKVCERLNYEKILFSFKPITEKEWLTEEEIKYLNE